MGSPIQTDAFRAKFFHASKDWAAGPSVFQRAIRFPLRLTVPAMLLLVTVPLCPQSGLTRYVMGDEYYPYSSQAKPAKGESYADSTYNATVMRITASKSDYGGWGTGTGYSTWDPLSSDGKYLILLSIANPSSAGGYVLFDAVSHQFVRHLPLLWWNGQDPEPRWDTSGENPGRVYYRRDKQLRYYDVAKKKDALVHDFSAGFRSYGSSYYIYNGEEGISSRDSRYWAFMLRNSAAPYETVRVIVYDRTLDQVIASKDVTGHAPDNVGMSPSGKYVYVAYRWTGRGDEFDGPHAYARDFSAPVKICGDIPHLSFGYTRQGNEVAVYMSSDHVAMTRLDTGRRFNLYYQGDLGWDGSNLLHAAVGPAKKGWGFISTYSPNNDYWDYNQIFAIELDETRTYNSGNRPRIWRVAHAQNIIGPNYYYQQPNAQMDFAGTRIWWGANWRDTGGAPEVYQVTLPAEWWRDLADGPPATPSANRTRRPPGAKAKPAPVVPSAGGGKSGAEAAEPKEPGAVTRAVRRSSAAAGEYWELDRGPGGAASEGPVNLGAFTWQAWVCVAGEHDHAAGPVIEQGNGSDIHKTLTFSATKASWQQRAVRGYIKTVSGGAETLTTDNAYKVGVWEHWAMTYDDRGDRKIRIYRDGAEPRYSVQKPAAGPAASDAGQALEVGATPGTAFFRFNGVIGGVRIYPRVLSTREIQAGAAESRRPPATKSSPGGDGRCGEKTNLTGQPTL